LASGNTKTFVLRGTLHWAKVLGKPRLNEYSGVNEWSVDLTPSPEGVKSLEDIGISDRLKTPKGKDSRKERYLTFRQKEKNKEGELNQPIRVQDIEGNPWEQNKLIGNGTTADVKFIVRDYGKGKPKGVYIQAIRVLDHVPYQSADFAPLDSDDEFFAGIDEVTAGPAVFDTDLDDDVPF
jgi:hypothetical protein